MATSYITDLMQSLHPEEIKIIKEQISRVNTKAVSSESKLEKLFTILSTSPDKEYTDGELSKLLNCSSGALRTLKSRLFEKTKEALVLDAHFENEKIFNYRERIVFTMKKKLLLAKSLYRVVNQKKITTINFLLDEVIKVSTENEIYEVLVEALTLHTQVKAVRRGLETFEKNMSRISFYENCYKAVNNANNEYYRYIVNQEFITSQSSYKIKAYLHATIKKMESDFKKTKAVQVNYFVYIFKIILLEREKKYDMAISLYKKLNTIIKKSKIIYSRDRMGFSYSNIGQFYSFLKNYKEALAYFQKARKFHIPESHALALLEEQEFYAHFYSKNYIKAIYHIDRILNHNITDIGTFHWSKFLFGKAYVFFATKKHKEVLQLLNKALEIEKDKAGLNIAIRFLLTMTFIELKKHQEASTSISTLRKHMERTGKTKEIKERDILIWRLLKELEKDGFKRNEKNKNVLKLISELSDESKPTAWNHFTPELIPFHEWVITLPSKN